MIVMREEKIVIQEVMRLCEDVVRGGLLCNGGCYEKKILKSGPKGDMQQVLVMEREKGDRKGGKGGRGGRRRGGRRGRRR